MVSKIARLPFDNLGYFQTFVRVMSVYTMTRALSLAEHVSSMTIITCVPF